jgi:putative addiction module component (TIGR02574 family)
VVSTNYLKMIVMNTQQVQLKIPLSFKQVVDIVKQLSPSEKQQLSEVLWTEQNIEDIVIPEEQKQLVRERIKKYENNPDSYLSWDDKRKV